MVEEEPLLAKDPEVAGLSTVVVSREARDEKGTGKPQQEVEAVASAGTTIVEIPSPEGGADKEEAFIRQKRPSPGEIVTS